jgi:hypothetical protein
MPVPWLRLLDLAIGVTSLARRAPRRAVAEPDRGEGLLRGLGPWRAGSLEARLTGVVVSALKEVFDRDRTRLEIEREQIEAERRRAERALRLELLRQAGDREVARLRLLAGLALAGWLGTLFFAGGLAASGAGRAAFAIGWLLLLGGLGTALSGQARIARALDQIGDHIDSRAGAEDIVSSGSATAWAPWMILGGLAATTIGVLVG